MLEIIKGLAETLVENSQGELSIAFNEASAAPFLKLKDKPLGHDFENYNSRVSNIEPHVIDSVRATLMISLLGDLVLPLERVAPKAYDAGLRFLEDKAPMLGELASVWVEVVQMQNIGKPVQEVRHPFAGGQN